MGKVKWFREFYAFAAYPAVGFLIGWKLEKMEDARLTRFRDKSALYGKAVPPAVPSWT